MNSMFVFGKTANFSTIRTPRFGEYHHIIFVDIFVNEINNRLIIFLFRRWHLSKLKSIDRQRLENKNVTQ